MVDDEGGRRPYPTWVRVLLIGLQALGIVVGLVVGVLTYDAWSQPDDAPATTTTVVTPETAVPPATLG
jgi:hypothetical protein